jgi:hypothetical protein
MQNRRYLLSVYLIFIFLISGCWEGKPNYLYLMVHSDYLQQAYNKCVQEIISPALPCELIMHAQADFTSLVNQREQDPERFGAQVLYEQADNISFKLKFEKALAAYNGLGKTHPNIEELKQARLELDKARDEYKLSNEKVLILLAVIAATSTV